MVDAHNMRFIVIGAGMAGILSAIRLRQAGYHDVTVIEKADRLGGTWRENTYPGIACDVPAHMYTYSFEPNPDWSHRFAPGEEIQAYFENVAHKYGVMECIRFGDGVVGCEFVDHRWQVQMESGASDVADVVIAATGVLHHPNVPDFPGIETFQGASFHSARWDHDVAMEGKRAGVIGTGSTAVQIVSDLVHSAGKVSMFQRTAQWVMKQENPEYADSEIRSFHEHPEMLIEMRESMSDSFLSTFATAVIDADSAGMKDIEAQCRENLDTVRDAELRARLTPDYRAACKRLVLAPDFYEAIQRPNAELVTAGIERIEPAGVRTKDGRLHELDVLVLATGFHPDRFIRPARVIGRNGLELDDYWAERPLAYLSISIPEFPNFFMLNGPNGPVGNFSLIDIAELQFAYILQLVDEIASGRCRELSPTQSATDAFEMERVEAAKNTIWTTGCRSWYLDDRGIPASWPFTFDRFHAEMAAPKLEAFELVR
ncbi:MAG: NAD(P)/FAD-dependent oxidoreductase [Gammaproteobacteria bacterium]|nr:NAD(P)/FAD-dependent oxidoreductase [Gammaproteobacteria bacterium]